MAEFFEQYSNLYGWTIEEVLDHTYGQLNMIMIAHNRNEKKKNRVVAPGGIKNIKATGF